MNMNLFIVTENVISQSHFVRLSTLKITFIDVREHMNILLDIFSKHLPNHLAFTPWKVFTDISLNAINPFHYNWYCDE